MLLKLWRRINASLFSLLLVTLLYALATVIMTYPVAFEMSSAVAGREAYDEFQYTWLLWWAKKALLELHTSPANLTYLYHPTGAYHPMLAATTYLELTSIPLQVLVGPDITYDVQFLLSFILTGLTTYLLCYYLTGNQFASFIGGLIFAFFPNRLAHAMGQLPQITTYWVPLYALFLIRLIERPDVKNAFLCGLFLTLSLSVSMIHIAYFIFPLTSVFLLHHYWANRERLLNVRFIGGLSLAFGMSGLLTAPFLLPLLIAKVSGQLGYLEYTGTIRYSADLLAFLTPSPGHPLFGRIDPAHLPVIKAMRASISETTENVVYLGILPSLLALWGSIKRRAGFWVLLGLCAAIFSLGPFLKAGGQLVQYVVEDKSSYVVLPYALIKKIPFFEWGRNPARLNMTMMFSVAVLVSYGTKAVLKGLESYKIKVGLTAGLTVLILFEYVFMFPFDTAGSLIPRFYRELRKDSDDYALLDLPMWPRQATSTAMYYQTFHQHRIVGGYIHRLPSTAEPMMHFIEQLVDPTLNTDDIIDYPDDINRPRSLSRYDIKYVVLHKRFLTEGRSAMISFLSRSLGEPVYEDAQISAFAVPEASSEGTEEGLLMILGPTWHSIESLEGVPSRWMINDGLVYVDTPLEGKYRLKFAALPFRDSRHLQVFVNDELIEEYEVDNFLRSYATKAFSLKQGWNMVEFHVPEGCERPSEVFEDAGDNRCLSLLFQEIRLLSAKADSIQHPLAADLNGEILLLGYDLKDDVLHPGEELHLTLYWQAQRDIEEDYTVFVHLVDDRGRVVAQRDAQPLEGAYPTSRWSEYETVRDEHVIAIPLETPPGEYQLKVGMYLLSTMERLWVVDDASGENRVLLGKVWIGDN